MRWIIVGGDRSRLWVWSFPRQRGRTAGKSPPPRNFVVFSVSNVSKCLKRLNTNEKSWHDGHGKKGLRVAVSCPLKTAVFQWKLDIGHVGHGNFIKSLRARNIHSFNYVRECDDVMWVCDRMYVIADIWKFVHVRYVSSHAHHGCVRLLVFVRVILKKTCDI